MNFLAFLILAFSSLACSPPCAYDSEFGICVLEDPNLPWTQEQFFQWERIFELRARDNPIWARKGRMRGWKIQIVQKQDWEDSGINVAGLTYCNLISTSLVGNAQLYANSLTHELIHAMQGCISPAEIDEHADADHSDWYREGYFSIIAKTKQQVYEAEGSP